MCGYGFGFAGALEHEELGEDGDGFEPDGEGPEDLDGGEGLVGALFVGREGRGGGDGLGIGGWWMWAGGMERTSVIWYL